MRKVATKVCKLQLFSQLYAPMKTGVILPQTFLHFLRLRVTASTHFRADEGVPNALLSFALRLVSVDHFQRRDVLL